MMRESVFDFARIHPAVMFFFGLCLFVACREEGNISKVPCAISSL